jgi:hypothetical protein
MKSKLQAFAILAVTLLAIVFWLLFDRPVAKQKQTQAEIQSNQSSTATLVTKKTQTQLDSPIDIVLPTNKADTITISNPQPQPSALTTNREDLVKSALEQKNVPINFYGKIIDQESNGLPGVHIVAHVRQWHLDATADSWGNKFPKFELTTDSDGRFMLENAAGDSLTIESVTKDGYRLSVKTEKTYGYGETSEPHHPDPNNPIIFKMWKESGIKEPLITGSHVFGMDSSKIYTLDLVQGQKIAGEANGDLRVSITRPSEINSKDRYPWSYSIQAVNGGLIESEDEFMYFAPESGYEPTFIRQYEPADADWNFDIPKQFFIRTRNGQVYGRAQVVIHSVYNVHSAIEISYAINPAGSRNLEP